MIENAMRYSHTLLKNTVIPGDTVIDATVGNGGDTILLAALVGKTGKVYGFDIQPQALQTTKEKLLLTGLGEQVDLYLQGHETLKSVVPAKTEIAAAIFNLGYLPKSDKKIITKGETTIQAIHAILPMLRKGGLVLLVIYSGHQGGQTEKDAVLAFTEQLPQQFFNVLHYGFINQRNDPPFLLIIEKK
ncbi:tRNA (mnm(5)s(2)U34)-methyltransferase [Carnobacterium mobile]|uniref:tRNA (mnm(5)s(2)U34)-methyltransferase n=1 Tax=Carnobacterium mobile TaxID=2750 RepID=UPI001865FE8B|nr:class I SAM-dependent methyltransferase [Carnobacterium mobile]